MSDGSLSAKEGEATAKAKKKMPTRAMPLPSIGVYLMATILFPNCGYFKANQDTLLRSLAGCPGRKVRLRCTAARLTS
jgi:hypothetical protein